MPWTRLVRRLRSRSRFEREMADEVRDHLERRAADLERGGLSAQEARRRARLEFGAVESYKEQVRDTRRFAGVARLPGQLWREVGLAVRRLRATPLFTLLAVASLTVGVGVTASVHAVIVSILWRPLGIPDANRLLAVTLTEARSRTVAWEHVMSRADFEDLRTAGTAFGEPAASAAFSQTVTSESASAVAYGEVVTGNYFTIVGVRPQLGRLIGPSDDRADAPPVAVLSHRFWRRAFAADPAIIGRIVRVGGTPLEVIGVAAEGFDGLNVGPVIVERWSPGVFVPFASAERFRSDASVLADRTNRNRRLLTVIARLRDDRLATAVTAELSSLGTRLDAAFPQPPTPESRFRAISAKRTWAVDSIAAFDAKVRGDGWQLEAFFMAIVGVTLAVACTNLTNLVLARGASRTREIAVRSALGASRARLVREQLIESVVLAAAGGLGACYVTRALLISLTGANLPVGRGRFLELEPAVSPMVVIVAAAALVMSLCVFGLLPALRMTRRGPSPAITGDGVVGPVRWSGRASLISWQVGVSTAFLIVAGFCARAILSESRHESGMELDRLAVGTLDFSRSPWNATRARRAVDDLMSLAPTQPDIESLALSTGLPFGTGLTPVMEVTTPDRPFDADPSKRGTLSPAVTATPSIFRTIGVSIVDGRGFEDRDSTSPVVVLSRRTALQLFGTSEAVGREVLVRDAMDRGGPAAPTRLFVIGIASDTDAGSPSMRSGGRPWNPRRYGAIYQPFSGEHQALLMVTARTSLDPEALAVELKTLVRRAHPDLVLEDAGSASAIVTGLDVTRVVGVFAALMALLSLLLSMTGLYGVLAQLVSRRTREMGVRLALGADRARLGRLVLADGLRPVVRGLAAGVGLGVLARLVLESQFASPPSSADALIFALVPVPLVAAAIVACYVPARRASRVDPNVALRDL